ncbi:ABC-2 type transport system permease protein [Halopolyspora algeriensis]|uniref:ABC-2 type transport system permease protein n=1 Tax=Halopolyspora algeriensis TaxID=1500506 RepID=A0A368VF63_9ACTN|nr:ABC transporter permease [Halopolyspora algeriensis]RCW39921.1 ABC-2 type transport system permease protein [Halopolyspora algeriensis]TQM46642.1 ABC-2 type transport system permease protein [Halopolyspora algeriensis]
MSLLLLHARYQFLETIRVPIAVIGTVGFPALFMLLFVVSNPAVGGEPAAATLAAGQMSLFAVISAYMFNLGAGVAEDRAKPWHAHLRTLPVGPAAQLGGRLLNAQCFALLSLIPVALTAMLFTRAHASAGELAAVLLALLLAGLPFAFMGLAIGYSLPLKAAIPVVQLLLLPMAFAGGLFLPPVLFPDWLDVLSHALPTRAVRDLVIGALTNTAPGVVAPLVAAGWTLVLGTLAVVAHRRDEGRRFR